MSTPAFLPHLVEYSSTVDDWEERLINFLTDSLPNRLIDLLDEPASEHQLILPPSLPEASKVPERFKSVVQFRRFLQEAHKELWDIHGPREIHFHMLKQFVEQRMALNEQDRKAPEGKKTQRWETQLNHAIRSCPMFKRSDRGFYLLAVYVEPVETPFEP
jgi:hypothetical protein